VTVTIDNERCAKLRKQSGDRQFRAIPASHRDDANLATTRHSQHSRPIYTEHVFCIL